ncbi:hypothetical protein [Sphingomonas sp.]|uniref:hypothetical protein n=1 Tax=Sphingomonas sp. TaxID=28214 RepID=UPI003CC6816F
MLRLAAAILIVVPALATAQGSPTPQRIRSVTIQRGQACPRSTVAGEVVVCSFAEEPYRIPRALRDDGPVTAANQSWAARAADVDQESRVAAGLPDTCSPIGTGGQSGCALAAARAYAAEKRAGNVTGRGPATGQ